MDFGKSPDMQYKFPKLVINVAKSGSQQSRFLQIVYGSGIIVFLLPVPVHAYVLFPTGQVRICTLLSIEAMNSIISLCRAALFR